MMTPSTTTATIRCSLYCRVSTGEQNPELQIREFTRLLPAPRVDDRRGVRRYRRKWRER